MLTGTCNTCHQPSSFPEHFAGLTLRCKLCGNGWVTLSAASRDSTAISEPAGPGATTASVTAAPDRVAPSPQPPPAPTPEVSANRSGEQSENSNTFREKSPAAPAASAVNPATNHDSAVRPPAAPWSPVRRSGLTLLAIGLGSFLLPLFGFQFRLVALFGDRQWIGGAIVAMIGAFMVAWTYLED